MIHEISKKEGKKFMETVSRFHHRTFAKFKVKTSFIRILSYEMGNSIDTCGCVVVGNRH